MEWKEVRLGDIVSIKSGLAYKGAFIGKGENILLGMGCVSFKDKFLFSGARPYEADCDDKYCVEPGDIVLATRQQSDNLPILAMPAIIPPSLKAKKIIYGTNLYKVENHSEVTNDFLFWQLKTPDYIDYISSVKTGSVVRMVTKKNVEDYVFRCPPKEVRDRISKLLWGLDLKIELNNKINADLEEMAQAIFKNWFVDFEPFKDGKFVDSELGMIPEGWKVSQIADIPHILETGKRPKGGAVEKGIPSVGAEHVKGMCAYDYSKNKYINCEFAAKLKTGKINGYELMIYKDGGKPGYFIPNFSIFGEGYPFENCYLNEHVFKLDFDGNKGFNIFCYFFFKTEQIMSYFNAQGAKAAIPGINKKDVENIYIFSPDNESVIKFGEFAYPLFKQMLKNAVENRTLSLLRDTLLPRLMSGEIEIPE